MPRSIRGQTSWNEWMAKPTENSPDAKLSLQSGGDDEKEAKVEEAARRPNEMPPAGQSRLRILAAEDSELNQFVLKSMLEYYEYELSFVKNGREAIEAWRASDFDLILMDIQMPVMDGVAAMREIRAIEARRGGAPTPIVALTANAMTHQLEEYKAAGANLYVSKPISESDLLDAISVCMAEPHARVSRND